MIQLRNSLLRKLVNKLLAEIMYLDNRILFQESWGQLCNEIPKTY